MKRCLPLVVVAVLLSGCPDPKTPKVPKMPPQAPEPKLMARPLAESPANARLNQAPGATAGAAVQP